MLDSPNISLPQLDSLPNRNSWQRYLILGFAINTGIWTAALLYLKAMPSTYVSQMTINIPSSSSMTQVEVPGIGGSSVQKISPYASSQDPRENYKILIDSEAVQASAAKQAGLSVKAFGEARIKLIDGTTLMKLELSGKTPTEARNKALSLYKALEGRLDQLRQQDTERRESKSQSTYKSARSKLQKAQQQLSDYQARSGLISKEQPQELSKNIELLRLKRTELVAALGKADARLKQLTNDLNLPASQASDAFLLQADPQFQQMLKNYSEIGANLLALENKFTKNSPEVIAERLKHKSAMAALIARGKQVLKHPVSEAYLDSLTLNNTVSPSARESLLKELVVAQAERKGLAVEVQESDREISKLEQRLANLAQLQASLDSRKRDVQIEEAVFSSKLTQMDVDRSNIYDIYPRIQIIAEPSLPKEPSSTKTLLLLGGAALASVLVSSGLTTHWFQQRKKQKPSVITPLLGEGVD